MIAMEDVKKSVIALIKPLSITIYAKEIKEGFKTPCFFIKATLVNSEMMTINFSENEVTVEIIYMSQTETDLENVKMNDILRSIFSQVMAINDRKLLPQKLRSDTEEYVLNFKFDLKYLDGVQSNIQALPSASKVIINLNGE